MDKQSTPTSNKRKKVTSNTLSDKYKMALKEIVESSKIEEPLADEYQHFGRFVESSLRKLNEENAINAMADIQSLLRKYRLKNIACSSRATNTSSSVSFENNRSFSRASDFSFSDSNTLISPPSYNINEKYTASYPERDPYISNHNIDLRNSNSVSETSVSNILREAWTAATEVDEEVFSN